MTSPENVCSSCDGTGVVSSCGTSVDCDGSHVMCDSRECPDCREEDRDVRYCNDWCGPGTHHAFPCTTPSSSAPGVTQ